MEYIITNKEKAYSVDINEKIPVNGRLFDADITLSSRFGDPNALNGGRILEILLSEGDEPIAYLKNKKWLTPVPDDDVEAFLAVLYLINRHSKKTDEREERMRYVHEG